MFVASSAQACPPRIIQSYRSGEFTDLTITCGRLTFKVHVLVVCSSCEFFKKSVTLGGKDSNERCIDLPEDDPEMIRRLITYLYLGDYDPTNSSDVLKLAGIDQHGDTTSINSTYHLRSKASGTLSKDPCACLAPNIKGIVQPYDKTGAKPAAENTGQKSSLEVQVASPLTIHATMYALGDKYHVQGLCELAKEKFESCFSHHTQSEDFVSAVEMVYSSTPDSNRGLRDIVVAAFETKSRTDITKIPGAEARLDAIDELKFHPIESWLAKIEEAKIEEGKTSPDPVVPSGLSAQPATTSGTALLPTSGADISPRPSSTHPVATAISPGGFSGGFGAFAPSQPPAIAQPSVTGSLNGSSNTVAASQRRLDFFGSASART